MTPIFPFSHEPSKGEVFSQTSSFSRSGYETKQDQASHMVRKVRLYDIIKHTYGMICLYKKKSMVFYIVIVSILHMNRPGQVESIWVS